MKTYYSIFNKTDPFERKHETDLYDMDNSMLDLLFRQAKRQTKRYINISKKFDIFQEYINYPIINMFLKTPFGIIVKR
ncbi:phage lytic cycle repressor MrpR family protein [Lysinibacillus fusiformis]|uniref:phage lytic cycle repressor MrpR family protein n=1 Tax=Lysinibacillus fusiformis TaxID=28031 RepID=UPI003556EEAF